MRLNGFKFALGSKALKFVKFRIKNKQKVVNFSLKHLQFCLRIAKIDDEDLLQNLADRNGSVQAALLLLRTD